jgi:hypothetical protein
VERVLELSNLTGGEVREERKRIVLRTNGGFGTTVAHHWRDEKK